MVNFKASGHQGEHKRALAAQGDESHAVSKLEKMKLRADAKCVNADGMALRVGAREKILGSEANAHVKAALVAPETLATLGAPGASRALLCRPGSDFVLSARAHADVEPGAVLLGEAQRLSLHVCEDESYEWIPFKQNESTLACLAIEAQLLTPPASGHGPIVIDAAALGRELAKRLFDEIVSDNEIFMYTFGATALVLRVTGAKFPERDDDDEEEEEEDDDDEQTAACPADAVDVGDDAAVRDGAQHCFRGLVDARTKVYVSRSTVFASSASQKAVCEGLELTGATPMPESPPKNCVHVLTADGEEFPVHRRLLKPCIALTKAVRDTSSAKVEAQVGVDCATFDRVLLFLESAGKGLAGSFAFDMNSLPSLAAAASSLGCRPLQESCAKRLGQFEDRIGMHTWADIVAHNDAGGCMVVMDGMVFDLKQWLPEHPGGETIIPQQALNRDCTVFFELYHAVSPPHTRYPQRCPALFLHPRRSPRTAHQRARVCGVLASWLLCSRASPSRTCASSTWASCTQRTGSSCRTATRRRATTFIRSCASSRRPFGTTRAARCTRASRMSENG